MNAGRPKIYLDNHFLSRGKDGGYLRDLMLESDEVIFIISSIHFIESMPRYGLSAEVLERNKRQFNLLSDCKSKIYIKPFHEVIGVNQEYKNIFCERSCLFGDLHPVFGDRSRVDVLLESMQENSGYRALNRPIRRRFVKDLSHSGRVSNPELLRIIEFMKFDAANQQGYRAELFRPLFVDGGLFDWIIGTVDNLKFSHRIADVMLDPKVFSLFLDSGNEFEGIINEFQQQLLSSMDRHVKKLDRAYAVLQDILLNPIVEKHMAKRIVREAVNSLRVSAAQRLDLEDDASSFKLIVDVLVDKIEIDLSNRNVDGSLNRIGRNDFYDALQVPYAQFVDIFCCDKETKHVLSRNSDLNAVLCKNDAELRAAVERYVG